MKFNAGDYIRYASNGVCLIDTVKKMRNPSTGKMSDFYVLKPINSNTSTTYVPVDSESVVAKMRYILKKEEIDSLILSVKSDEDLWIDDRKLRCAKFKSIISESDQGELLRLVSCLYLKRTQLEECKKKLSASDEAILKQAESIIENEFSFVLNISTKQVGGYIRDKLGI